METFKLKTFTKWPVNLLFFSRFISDQGKHSKTKTSLSNSIKFFLYLDYKNILIKWILKKIRFLRPVQRHQKIH